MFPEEREGMREEKKRLFEVIAVVSSGPDSQVQLWRNVLHCDDSIFLQLSVK